MASAEDEASPPKMRNLALGAKVRASTNMDRGPAALAVDGKLSTRWLSHAAVLSWLEIDLGEVVRVGGVHLYSGAAETAPLNNFLIRYQVKGEWKDIPSGTIRGNDKTAVWVKFADADRVVTNKLRLVVAKTKDDISRVKEIAVWPYLPEGIPRLGHGYPNFVRPIEGEDIPVIYVNQSGYNLNRPKSFTAPTLENGVAFVVRKKDDAKPLYEGVVKSKRGDFTAFNPVSDAEYVVEAGGHSSFPFRIGPYWLERVTYQNAIDFMIGSRHHLGTFRDPIGNSIGWRDDCHFAYELNTLVAQYLSNPAAYERMPSKIRYEVSAEKKYWGALDPYDPKAPDIVKLIHWGADVIVTAGRTQEQLKEQLAYFLYAWPWLKEWLPEQNYRVVQEFAFKHWGDEKADVKYGWDKVDEHNLFALKTVLGTTKGENPPGHSIQPNLLMSEVAKREGREDAAKYFEAARAQTQWLIENLDWEDPQTTKGQRMSEHVTMTGLSHFARVYPDQAPAGLREKIADWARVMIRRSNNMWDFRKLTNASDWVPFGSEPTMWNEPGNVAGFPAAALAAAEVLDHPQLKHRLTELASAHMDNVFGRNPTGRHFSYDAPKQVEGVEIGWYSKYGTGVGMLADVRFVLEASPKREHYPYNPAAGNIGWSEGWVNHNTAFNASLAAMAHRDTEVHVVQRDDSVHIRLLAPLNFDYENPEPLSVVVRSSAGDSERVTVSEYQPYSEQFVGQIKMQTGEAKPGDGTLQVEQNGTVETSYGYGYLERRSKIRLEQLVTPKMEEGAPAAGKRVRHTAPGYEGTEVFHSLYLPKKWKPDGKYPVLVEYTGNKWGKSTGRVEDAKLGYGLTGGEQFIWVVLPFIEKNGQENAVTWWGDLKASLDYCKVNVPRICEDYGGDPDNVFLCGFSRGAIAVNYIGLHDDEIAKLWKGFITHDHYEGVFPVSDAASALERLSRLNGRPQLISSVMGTDKTREYLAPHIDLENIRFLDVPVNQVLTTVPSHTDHWMQIDSAYRQRARKWLREVVESKGTED